MDGLVLCCLLARASMLAVVVRMVVHGSCNIVQAVDHEQVGEPDFRHGHLCFSGH